MEKIILNVKTRLETGTFAARKLRAQGIAPAVIYSKNETPVHVSVDQREFIKFLHKHGETAIISLKTEGEKKDAAVIIKEVQYDTIKSRIIHIDFQRIKLDEKIRVHVPIITKGDADAPGVKEGGNLEHILREVEVEGLPTNIPKEIVVDVSNMKIGDAIHIKELVFTGDIVILNDPEQVAVLVKFESEEKAEETIAEEVSTAEPEVIKKGKAEEGEAAAKK
ncbi:MAG: 50S ribosomal protein L25 [Candidatus Omnitrophica bacterium]|nr:50S ribosomal protein L25 [Candidatus Omnitrophota bacterium]